VIFDVILLGILFAFFLVYPETLNKWTEGF